MGKKSRTKKASGKRRVTISTKRAVIASDREHDCKNNQGYRGDTGERAVNNPLTDLRRKLARKRSSLCTDARNWEDEAFDPERNLTQLLLLGQNGKGTELEEGEWDEEPQQTNEERRKELNESLVMYKEYQESDSESSLLASDKNGGSKSVLPLSSGKFSNDKSQRRKRRICSPAQSPKRRKGSPTRDKSPDSFLSHTRTDTISKFQDLNYRTIYRFPEVPANNPRPGTSMDDPFNTMDPKCTVKVTFLEDFSNNLCKGMANNNVSRQQEQRFSGLFNKVEPSRYSPQEEEEKKHQNHRPSSGRGKRQHMNQNYLFGEFIRKFRNLSHENYGRSVDNDCMFLAQNQGHMVRLLMDRTCWQDREIVDSMICMLKEVFGETSLLCQKSRLQLMAQLKFCNYFESAGALNIAKSLLCNKNRAPDKSDVAVSVNLLEVLLLMLKARVLAREDAVVFLGTMQTVLSMGDSQLIVEGNDIRTAVTESVHKLQSTVQQNGALHGRELNDQSFEEWMDLDIFEDLLGPILPDICDIRNNRAAAELHPRHYLDSFQSSTEYVRYIYFSFREDFIGPLCKGIREYKDHVTVQKPSSFFSQEVRLYENVRVIDTALSQDTDVDFTIRIDSSRIRNFHSRLNYGSLVCLSRDGFNTIIYATVSDRDPTKMKLGLLNIHLIEQTEVEDRVENTDNTVNNKRAFLLESVQGQNFTMLESTAFYTAYVYTLKSLKALYSCLSVRQSSLPFSKQLVEMSKDVGYPRYVEASKGSLSFLCMRPRAAKANPLGRPLQDHSVQANPDLVEVSSVEKHLRKENKHNIKLFKHNDQNTKDNIDLRNVAPERVHEAESENITLNCAQIILDRLSNGNREHEQIHFRNKNHYISHQIDSPQNWPSAEDLGLDPSQYAALRLALTHKVALIQGPPGTGKTFLGLRITEVLLNNEHLWHKGNMLEQTPLLLLSYTNHALDQFLIELLKLPVMKNCEEGDIVRVGSRSEKNCLVPYNICKLRKMFTGARTFFSERSRLTELRESRNNIDSQIKSCLEGIVHLRCFYAQKVISDSIMKSFHRKTQKDDLPLIVEWLCLHQDDFGLNQTPERKRVSAIVAKNDGYTRKSNETKAKSNHLRDLNTPLIKNKDQEIEDPYLETLEREMDLEEEHERRVDLEDCEDSDGENSDSEHSQSGVNSEEKVKLNCGLLDCVPDCDLGKNYTMAVPRKEALYDLHQLFPKKLVQPIRPDTFYENLYSKILYELESNDVMSEEEESLKTVDVWQIEVNDRWRLYRLWLRRLLAPLRQRRESEEMEFRWVSKRVEELRSLTDLRVMKQAKVVAMTTTGAARCTHILRKLGARVVLVEEAAQVSEAHLLSSLSPRCEHLIMIGDHQQLRPSYNNYDLTARHHRHHIDISLFERLCRAGVPFRCLSLQHRMRPEISSLLVPTIYTSLEDHGSVFNYPQVRGIKTNIFFLSHEEPEDEVEESRSKRNTHEANLLASLYKYLRMQDYSETDITILTLYKDQVILLRKLIKEVEASLIKPQRFANILNRSYLHEPPPPRNWGRWETQVPAQDPQPCQGARVTAVDNFQGEESRIVLLSLVRSNVRGRIGYLREANRVCVALSRAKEGMYVVGNCSLLTAKSKECWAHILQQAQVNGWLGQALPLYCARHEHVTKVLSHTDIEHLCLNGGCNQRCEARLKCGHVCDRQCHDPSLFHADPCVKPCVRKCPNGHTCPSTCGKLPCPPCKERCAETLPCQHRCQAHCAEPCTSKCKEFVKVKGRCGHEFQTLCHEQEVALCKVKCFAVLRCGHLCKGTCGTCFAGRLHQPCTERCKRVLVCGHECGGKCTQSCPPCEKPCRLRCPHSRECCKEKCGYPCSRPCIEPCLWACKKQCKEKLRCSKLCMDFCDRGRCNEPCRSFHNCPTCRFRYKCRGLFCEAARVRGQRAPQSSCLAACPRCNGDIFNVLFGSEDEPDARFYTMPDCGCVLEVSGLDQYMDMADDDGSVHNKRCPKCQSPVLTAQRYGNVLRRINEDMTKVKEKVLTTEADLRTKRNRLVARLGDVQKTSAFQAAAVHWTEKQTQFRDSAYKFLLSARTLQQLAIVENQINFTEAISRLWEKTCNNPLSLDVQREQLLRLHLDNLWTWTTSRNRGSFDEQQLEEFPREATRMHVALIFSIAERKMKMLTLATENELKQAVERSVERLFDKQEVLSAEEERDMRSTAEQLKKAGYLGGLGVSEEERVMVVQAMQFEKGHWFKCPNGHVYCIGECGGAMEKSTCPECGAVIGGENHASAAGNTLAAEMDGASAPAWPRMGT